jgi:hypothetical protein
MVLLDQPGAHFGVSGADDRICYSPWAARFVSSASVYGIWLTRRFHAGPVQKFREVLKAFFDQQPMIPINRNQQPMAFVPNLR